MSLGVFGRRPLTTTHLSASFLVVLVAGTVLIGALSTPGVRPGPSGAGPDAARPSTSGPVPTATQVSLSSNGASPAAISLKWTQSGDVFFSSYTVKMSNSNANGPWQTLGTISVKSDTTYYVYGLSPGATDYWQIIDTDSFGSATSNTFQSAQPNVAPLSYTQPTATSVLLSWTNPATYGGAISFTNYQVAEAINGSVHSMIATITAVGTTTYLVSSIQAGVHYNFEIATTDQCSICSSSDPSVTDSTQVDLFVEPQTTGGGGGSGSGSTTAANSWIMDNLLYLVIGIVVLAVVLAVVFVTMRRRGPPPPPSGTAPTSWSGPGGGANRP